MNKNKNKLSLINFDLKGNKTIIRAKYNFIIKILNWLGQKNIIEIEYVNREIKLEVTPTPSSGLPIRIKKILDKKSTLEKGLEKRAIKIDKMLRKRAEAFIPAGKKVIKNKTTKKNAKK